MKNKMIITLLIACMLVQQTRAQGNGLAGIQEATQMITSYFDPDWLTYSTPNLSMPLVQL